MAVDFSFLASAVGPLLLPPHSWRLSSGTWRRMFSGHHRRHHLFSILLMFFFFFSVAVALALTLAVPVTAGGGFRATDVNLPEGARLMAFGDINSDKGTDAWVVRPTDTVYPQAPASSDMLEVHLWHRDDNEFRVLDKHGPLSYIVEPTGISSVVPGDFNHDGHMDVLVTGPLHGINESVTRNDGLFNQTSYVHIYLGHLMYFDQLPVSLPNAIGQLLVLDYNNDLLLDLYGTAAGTGRRAIWVNVGLEPGNSARPQFELVPHTDLPQNAYGALASPHSSSFVDLNGDCLSDLFLVTEDVETGARQYEIWLNFQRSGWIMHSAFAEPAGAGQVAWADFDGDGTMDLVIPVASPLAGPDGRGADNIEAGGELRIFYNQQLPMCSSPWKSSSGCRGQQNLCTADHNWRFDNLTAPMPTIFDSGFVVVKVPAEDAMVVAPGAGIGGSVLTVRAGDYDLDGFADLLIIVNSTDVVIPNPTPRVTIWKSVECTYATCAPLAVKAGRRTFARLGGSDSFSVESVAHAYGATWFDIDDKGMLDILILAAEPQAGSSRSNHRLVAMRNQFEVDAFFLTTLGSNGVCPAWCSSGAKFPDPKPYGVNHPGISIKFTVTSLSGSKQVRQVAQLPQSAFSPLATPYQLSGLGRTSNYIEELFVGVPLKTSPNYNMWVAMIPNSQLIIFPYPPGTPSEWTLELFISPSDRLIMVVIALATTLVGLAMIIAFFQFREHKEDEGERRQTQQLFVF